MMEEKVKSRCSKMFFLTSSSAFIFIGSIWELILVSGLGRFVFPSHEVMTGLGILFLGCDI
jgi:hypothetical protein